MSTEQNKSIVYRWVEEAWNQGNYSSARALYPPTYRLNDGSSPDPIVGADSLSTFIGTFRSAMPDLRMTIEQVVAEGEMVVWRFCVEGTQTGDLLGAPPSNQRVTTSGIVMSRFQDGKWVEDFVNWDLFGLLRQIGAIPAASQ